MWGAVGYLERCRDLENAEKRRACFQSSPTVPGLFLFSPPRRRMASGSPGFKEPDFPEKTSTTKRVGVFFFTGIGRIDQAKQD